MVWAQHSSPGLSVCIEFTSVIFQFPFPNDRTFFLDYAVFFYVEYQNISVTPHCLPSLTPGTWEDLPSSFWGGKVLLSWALLNSAVRRLNAFPMQLQLLHKEMRSAKTLSFVFSLTNSRSTMSQNSGALENWQKETWAFKELSPPRIRGRAEEEPWQGMVCYCLAEPCQNL